MKSDIPRGVQLLPPQVAEKIAAGEVIERPASVVKELVENSLDAGATEVLVALEEGGRSMIEVLDNGDGMAPSDLELCIQRHATSKIRSFEDLGRLHTLGFRGEALPSIRAVSRMNLISREKGAESAYELDLAPEAQEDSARSSRVTFGHFLGSPHGSRIRVSGLFAQIPARLKFLRSPASEVAHVREWIERLALSRPEIGFRLVNNDRTVLNLRPETMGSRVRAVLSAGKDYPVIEADNMESGGFHREAPVHVRAYWLQGMSTPQTRKVIQIVNGRAVRDKLLQQAILSPFRQALLPGQFPGICVSVELDPAEIDVNAHPTKTEIRLIEPRKIFHAIESLIASMIASHGASGYAAGSVPAWSRETWQKEGAHPSFDRNHSQENASLFQAASFSASPSAAPSTPASDTISTSTTNGEATHPFTFGRFAGSLFNTYLLYDLGEELGLIDQHAAHERVRFEALRERAFNQTNEGRSASQVLLVPEAVRFDAENRISLESRLSWLERLGFDAELFGEETVLFRSVPAEWGTDQLRPRLQNLLERVLSVDAGEGRETTESSQLAWDETIFEKLASEACHSAIRAGDRLDAFEAEKLLEELFRCTHPWNCPHGRPTTVRIPKGRFEEWFQRRV